MRTPKLLLTGIFLFNVSQSLFAQSWAINSGSYYANAPVASTNSTGFTQLWPDNAIIWKNGNSLVGGLRFGSATNLGAANWIERMRITDNGFVGIGTEGPRGKLDIWGGAMYVTGSDIAGTLVAGAQGGNAFLGCNSLTNGIAISPGGSVGITTTSPQALFSLGGGNGTNGKKFLIKDDGTANGVQAGMGIDMSGTGRELSVFHSTSNGIDGDISFGKRLEGAGTYTEAMRVTGTGKVGIGTVNTNDADYKLFVETGIRTRKVKVDQANWPDYVFHTTFRLRPLSEVEQYINQHHHLPEVPSAEEVEKEGLNVGDNQAMLLKKIEELTLYVIEQNKKIQTLELKVERLEKNK
jgi:hypothetical protein